MKWVGTEEPTTLRGPVWSTGNTRQGDPGADTFVPAGCDTVMLTPHHWFLGPPSKPRTLASLIATYHASVGSNCVLELGMAVNKEGLVPSDQAALAARFGAWVKRCYGQPLGVAAGNGSVLLLTLPAPATVDRISVGEDLRFGQLVRAYSVSARKSAGAPWVTFSRGTSVGHKKIDILGSSPMEVVALR
eukprot:COSAG01_NODE_3996_length_5448_cov_24.489250_6_plen_189_part_00